MSGLGPDGRLGSLSPCSQSSTSQTYKRLDLTPPPALGLNILDTASVIFPTPPNKSNPNSMLVLY